MVLRISGKAEQDLDIMTETLRKFFIKHMEKLEKMPPRKHMRFGLPYFVEDVTKQARMIYGFEGETLIVLRCFATHKEYEKWYLSYK
jgi:hypothetical protein